MSDTQTTVQDSEVQAGASPNVQDVCRGGRPVGLILHAHGCLRLFTSPVTGHLVAEVVGMRTPDSRDFLELLAGLPDVTDEVLVGDAPELYGLDACPELERHTRRRAPQRAGGRP